MTTCFYIIINNNNKNKYLSHNYDICGEVLGGMYVIDTLSVAVLYYVKLIVLL